MLYQGFQLLHEPTQVLGADLNKSLDLMEKQWRNGYMVEKTPCAHKGVSNEALQGFFIPKHYNPTDQYPWILRFWSIFPISSPQKFEVCDRQAGQIESDTIVAMLGSQVEVSHFEDISFHWPKESGRRVFHSDIIQASSSICIHKMHPCKVLRQQSLGELLLHISAWLDNHIFLKDIVLLPFSFHVLLPYFPVTSKAAGLLEEAMQRCPVTSFTRNVRQGSNLNLLPLQWDVNPS